MIAQSFEQLAGLVYQIRFTALGLLFVYVTKYIGFIFFIVLYYMCVLYYCNVVMQTWGNLRTIWTN